MRYQRLKDAWRSLGKPVDQTISRSYRGSLGKARLIGFHGISTRCPKRRILARFPRPTIKKARRWSGKNGLAR